MSRSWPTLADDIRELCARDIFSATTIRIILGRRLNEDGSLRYGGESLPSLGEIRRVTASLRAERALKIPERPRIKRFRIDTSSTSDGRAI
jgi:hypothetical protein